MFTLCSLQQSTSKAINNGAPHYRATCTKIHIQSEPVGVYVTGTEHSRCFGHCITGRTGRGDACVLTFQAVLTGGGERRSFLYPQHDTTAPDHPILGGCQPAQHLHFQTSLAFT